MSASPLAMPQPGDRIGPYRLVSVAGQGGMGVVYRAADTLLSNRSVAVKVMAAHLSSGDAYRAAFLHEAQVAAEVNHPHVVPVHAAGEDGGLLYLAMAWIEGEDLRALARAGAVSLDRLIDAVRQVARALDALHEAGIIHGDVKPSNVIVHRRGGDDHAYLVDFGVARRVEFDDPRTNELVGGTPAYAAPESLRGHPGPPADQYALACVLFELVTGEKPFGSGPVPVLAGRHGADERPRISDWKPALAHLDEPVLRAMAVDPADRFPTGTAFGRALEAAQREAAGLPTSVVRRPPLGPDETDPLAAFASEMAGGTELMDPVPSDRPQGRDRLKVDLAPEPAAAAPAAPPLRTPAPPYAGAPPQAPGVQGPPPAQAQPPAQPYSPQTGQPLSHPSGNPSQPGAQGYDTGAWRPQNPSTVSFHRAGSPQHSGAARPPQQARSGGSGASGVIAGFLVVLALAALAVGGWFVLGNGRDGDEISGRQASGVGTDTGSSSGSGSASSEGSGTDLSGDQDPTASVDLVTADRSAIRRLLESYASALGTGDRAALNAILASDVVRVGSDGITGACVTDEGRAAALRRWTSQFANLGGFQVFSPASSALKISGDTATVTADYAIGSESRRPLEFEAARSEGGAWRITRVVAPCRRG